jgi:3-oxoadipate enol-lactonase
MFSFHAINSSGIEKTSINKTIRCTVKSLKPVRGKMPFLQRTHVEIFYTSWGSDGEWVTLLNGFMRSSTDFTLLAKGLVNAGYRVLALDNRGTGRTQYSADFTLADMVDDVVAVWQKEEVVRSHVIGFSMGGFLAQLLAAQESGRLSSLSLVSSCLHPNRILRPNASWSEDVVRNQVILGKYVSPSFGSKNQGLLLLMARAIATAVEKNQFLLHADRQLKALQIYEPPSKERLRALSFPVLILHGIEDEIIPIEEAHRLQAAFFQSHFAAAEEAGHLLLAEKSTWLLSSLVDFLKGFPMK